MTALATADLLAALPHLRRYARVLTGDVRKADELLLDTVGLAREAFPGQARDVPLRTRLFGVMHQLYNAGGARIPRPREVTGVRLEPAAESPPAGVAGLQAEFQRLPVAEREILLLVAVEGMGYQEIASVLEVPVATVVVRVRRARELLHGANRRTPDSEAQE